MSRVLSLAFLAFLATATFAQQGQPFNNPFQSSQSNPMNKALSQPSFRDFQLATPDWLVPPQKAPERSLVYEKSLSRLMEQMSRNKLAFVTRSLAERENLCYTMRSYHFSRDDDRTPVMDNMTTCAPSTSAEAKRVRKEPAAKFVPLTDRSVNHK